MFGGKIKTEEQTELSEKLNGCLFEKERLTTVTEEPIGEV